MRVGSKILTKEEIKAQLSVVADMLEKQEFHHSMAGEEYIIVATKKNFNLDVTAESSEEPLLTDTSHDDVNEDYNCGTVACIGGWCWLLNNEKPVPRKDGKIIYDEGAIERADEFVEESSNEDGDKLHDLFYPPFRDISLRLFEEGDLENSEAFETIEFENVTPRAAAKAIRNYLKSGDPDWESIMKEQEL